MSTKIEQLIDEIDDYIEGCKYVSLSSTYIKVNKDEIQELIRDLRMKTPDEIKRYQKIISNKEAILNDARAKAEALINEAAVHTNELVSEHEIMQQAHAQAQEIVELATVRAQEILDRATIEANEMRAAAIGYTDANLGGMEDILTHSIDIAAVNYEKLITQLNEMITIIQENRAQLYPVEEMAAVESETRTVMPQTEDASKTEGLDVI
ncbi:MAG: vacuolar family H+-ATPase subunit H [Lachnospiraceae bacterium]|nr:vacuolar family H+-ATPase subunit H [Lachnospiraceae bacterium]